MGLSTYDDTPPHLTFRIELTYLGVRAARLVQADLLDRRLVLRSSCPFSWLHAEAPKRQGNPHRGAGC